MSTGAVYRSDCNVAKIAFGLDLQACELEGEQRAAFLWRSETVRVFCNKREDCLESDSLTKWPAPATPCKTPRWRVRWSAQPPKLSSRQPWISRADVWYYFPKQSAFIAFPPGVLVPQSALQRFAMYQETGNNLKKGLRGWVGDLDLQHQKVVISGMDWWENKRKEKWTQWSVKILGVSHLGNIHRWVGDE